MIYIIDMHNRAAFAHYLQIMHRQRYKIYVERLKWDEIDNPTGYDCDEYDDGLAHYLVAISETGQVQGGVRLVPTDCPNMLRDHYAHLVADGMELPCHAREWEIDRFFVWDQKAVSDDGHDVRRQLFMSMVEYAIGRGIRALTGVFPMPLYHAIMELPCWSPEALGLPQEDLSGGVQVAVRIPVGPETLQAFQDYTGCRRSFLVEREQVSIELPPCHFDAVEMHELGKLMKQNPAMAEELLPIVKGLTSGSASDREVATRRLEFMLENAPAPERRSVLN